MGILLTHRRLHRSLGVALVLGLALTLMGCTGDHSAKQPASGEKAAVTLVDWTGHEESFESCPERVVAVSGSLGEVWLDAGGVLLGTTEDAVTERELELSEDIAIVGTIKEPNLEKILDLEPDFVILSADIASHQDLANTLSDMSISYGLFHEEYFADYLELLKQFTQLTQRDDLYEKNGIQVQERIQEILAEGPDLEGKTVLLLRAYSSGFKAKDSENLAGTMLKDFGVENILDRYDTLLEEISIEEILMVDPDYIFVTIMGSDTEAAIAVLEAQLVSNPSWSSLTAIQNDRYEILPKDLFHYKPNARWAEAYEYLLDRFAAAAE